MRSSPSVSLLVVAIVCLALHSRWGFCQQAPADATASAACRGIISGTIPHPTDCTRYFVCWQGTGVTGQCSPNYVFNPRVMFCVHQSQYRCPTEPETTVGPEVTSSSTVDVTEVTTPGLCVQTPWEAHFCWNHASELIRNPVNCTQYIDCERSPQANHECPPGRVFSLSYQDCFPGNERTCQMEPLAEDFCDGRPAGSYAHPYQCNRFVTCFRGMPRLDTCPPSYVFEESRLRCVHGDVVKCSSLLAEN
uniref:Putative chitin binding peritrophin-a domain protein n=1 Tax=Culex tarsalis TaxID=7177 RepID=A0A1Q3FQX7_CULTA